MTVWMLVSFFLLQSMQFAPCGTKCDDSGTDLGLAYGNRSAVLFRLHKYQVEGFWRIHSTPRPTHTPIFHPLSPLHLHIFSSLLLSLPRTFISKYLVCMYGIDYFSLPFLSYHEYLLRIVEFDPLVNDRIFWSFSFPFCRCFTAFSDSCCWTTRRS